MTETSDQAATRRRWITLAEVVAVAGVLIAALTLWTSWSDRRADRADRLAQDRQAAAARGRFEVRALPSDKGDALVIQRDDDHALKDVTIRFPTPLGVAAQNPADFTISRDGFRAALLKATDGGPDARTGRLPVLLRVQYWDGDVVRDVTGIYDVIWRTEGSFPFGRTLKLEGLRLRQRGGTPAALDAAWAKEAR